MTPRDPLGMAQTLRTTLRESVSQLEQAAAGPASAPAWRSVLAASLHDVRKALIAHMDEVESGDGLLARIAVEAPHLASSLDRIREEHGELLEDVDQVLDAVDPAHGADAEVVRGAVLELMRMISRHRQHGADVVYDAWSVDIGALP